MLDYCTEQLQSCYLESSTTLLTEKVNNDHKMLTGVELEINKIVAGIMSFYIAYFSTFFNARN